MTNLEIIATLEEVSAIVDDVVDRLSGDSVIVPLLGSIKEKIIFLTNLLSSLSSKIENKFGRDVSQNGSGCDDIVKPKSRGRSRRKKVSAASVQLVEGKRQRKKRRLDDYYLEWSLPTSPDPPVKSVVELSNRDAVSLPDPVAVAEDSVLDACLGHGADDRVVFTCDQNECDLRLESDLLVDQVAVVAAEKVDFFRRCAEHLRERHGRIARSVFVRCIYDSCEFVAGDKAVLRNHIISAHKRRNFREKCADCKVVVLSRRFEEHLKKCPNSNLSSRRKTLCIKCGKEFSGPNNLKWHEMKIHGALVGDKTNILKCEYEPECGFWTNNKSEHAKHMYGKHKKLMDGFTLFKCSKCDYKSVSRFIIRKHESIHETVKGDYLCQCGAMLKSEASLRIHMKQMHSRSGKKRIPCLHCGQTFSRAQTAKDHEVREHAPGGGKGKKPFRCPYCTHESHLSGNCLKHVRHIHPGKELCYVDSRSGELLLKTKGGLLLKRVSSIDHTTMEGDVEVLRTGADVVPVCVDNLPEARATDQVQLSTNQEVPTVNISEEKSVPKYVYAVPAYLENKTVAYVMEAPPEARNVVILGIGH